MNNPQYNKKYGHIITHLGQQGLGPQLAMLMDYSWLYTRKLLQVVLRGTNWCQAINLAQSNIRQVAYTMYFHPGPYEAILKQIPEMLMWSSNKKKNQLSWPEFRREKCLLVAFFSLHRKEQKSIIKEIIIIDYLLLQEGIIMNYIRALKKSTWNKFQAPIIFKNIHYSSGNF